MRHNLISPRDWLRIRWTIVRFRILTLIARSRYGTHLRRIDEFHPMFNSDEFGKRTISRKNRDLYDCWLMELKEYRHNLDFPELYFSEMVRDLLHAQDIARGGSGKVYFVSKRFKTEQLHVSLF